MASVCFLSLVENWEPVQAPSSRSSSLQLFANLKPGMLRDTTVQKVVVKMSLSSEADDNSLDVERSVYMEVRKKIKQETPHVLEGLFEGTCKTDDVIKKMQDSMNPSEASLYSRWFMLRTKARW